MRSARAIRMRDPPWKPNPGGTPRSGRYDGGMAVTAVPKLDAHKLRADFPIFEQRFHGKPLSFLDSAASSQKPRQMLDAMRDFYETSYANVHRGVYQLAERATEGLENAREKVRALLNAPSAREVIFVRNATEGLNLVAYAWGLNNLGPGDLGLDDLDRFENAKIVATGYVSNSLGTINPVERLSAWAHEQGAIMVCDGAQAAPHLKVDVQALGCDFVAISGHTMC